MAKRKIKVGLIINEFFGGMGTPFGGYGILARNYIAKYIPNEDIDIEVLLGGSVKRDGGKYRYIAKKEKVDNVTVYKLPRKNIFAKIFLWFKNYDLYLSIEMVHNYIIRNELRRKKLILWIQDPRPKYEWDEIETVKLFPEPNYYEQPIYDLVNKWYRQGRVRFVSQGHFLNQKAIDLYNLDKNVKIQYMPNPIDIDHSFDLDKHDKKNQIIFLGRVESVKRGWIFCEIAKRLPEYEFHVLGKTQSGHDKISKIMQPYMDLPNLHFEGHTDGERKIQFLKDSKILVNTSIHEALPVSFLEALSYGTVLVSNRNPDDLTSKFGIWTGDVIGDGFDKVDLYVDVIRELIENDKLRRERAAAGLEYIKQIHNVPQFVHDLRTVIKEEAAK